MHAKKIKYLQKYFTYLNSICQTTTNLRSNSAKDDYNNLTFEVHANNSLKIMYPEIIILFS